MSRNEMIVLTDAVLITAIVQRGLADMVVQVAQDAGAQGATIFSAQDVHQAPINAVISQIRDVLGTGPCYLSFDIDGLDPGFAPGTGTPEIGGLASWQAQAILRGMAGVDFRGADVVEVAPAYDVAEITALAAATMAWEYLCLFAKRK